MAVTRNDEKAITDKRISEAITRLKRMGTRIDYDSKNLLENLELLKRGKGTSKIKPLYLYAKVLEETAKGDVSGEKYVEALNGMERIYADLFYLDENTPGFEENSAVFEVLLEKEGPLLLDFFDLPLFSTFEDKMNYVILIQIIHAQNNAKLIFDRIKEYALSVREYLVDDMGYLTHLMKVIMRLGRTMAGEHKNVIEEELARIRRSNGIYDIDPVKLAQVESKVGNAELIIDNGKEILATMEEKRKNLEFLTDELEQRAKDIQKDAAKSLEIKALRAKGNVEAAMVEFMEGQKRAVIMDKDLLVRQVYSDAETELARYRAMAETIISSMAAKIAGYGKDADQISKKLSSALSQDNKIKKFMETAKRDDALLEKIEKLTILNDTGMEALSRLAVQSVTKAQTEEKDDRTSLPQEAAGVVPAAGVTAGEMKQTVPGSVAQAVTGGAVQGVPFYGAVPVQKEEREIPPVNPMLDRTIPFQQRFALAMKEKERRIEQGELFHDCFDDVLIAVMQEANPYLIGPSGCGKTFMVKQIQEILGMDGTDIGYINEEYDILGYVNAMGSYCESNFYRLYKYGGLAFCDELDNGNSKATVKLNSFLTNRGDSDFLFPGGERVQKHPNFRVIAAGNTDGKGSDVNYNTREKIEESVLQRMIPIYVDYDNKVEREILSEYPAWFEFAKAFRVATTKYGEASGMPAPGIFTTRDAYRIKQYLDDGCYSPEKIMQFEFIQTKEPEYLDFLAEEMKNCIAKKSAAYDVLKIFNEQSEAVKKRGR